MYYLCVAPADHSGIEGGEANPKIRNVELLGGNFGGNWEADNSDSQVLLGKAGKSDQGDVVDGVGQLLLAVFAIVRVEDHIFWRDVEVLRVFETKVVTTTNAVRPVGVGDLVLTKPDLERKQIRKIAANLVNQ